MTIRQFLSLLIVFCFGYYCSYIQSRQTTHKVTHFCVQEKPVTRIMITKPNTNEVYLLDVGHSNTDGEWVISLIQDAPNNTTEPSDTIFTTYTATSKLPYVK